MVIKTIAGKDYKFMEIKDCQSMQCCWFNEHDNKCMLSGQLVAREINCIRYHQWLQRKQK